MASKITITITAEQAMGASWSYLFAVEDDFEWIAGPDGKRRPGIRIGTRYTVAMLHNCCAPLIVRTPEITPAISAEEVAAACLSGNLIRVELRSFSSAFRISKAGLSPAVSLMNSAARTSPFMASSMIPARRAS